MQYCPSNAEFWLQQARRNLQRAVDARARSFLWSARGFEPAARLCRETMRFFARMAVADFRHHKQWQQMESL